MMMRFPGYALFQRFFVMQFKSVGRMRLFLNGIQTSVEVLVFL